MSQYGVWAKRSGYSIAGPAEAWLKSDGKPLVFDTKEEAAEYARKTNEGTRSPHVSYYPKEIDFEIKETTGNRQYIYYVNGHVGG